MSITNYLRCAETLSGKIIWEIENGTGWEAINTTAGLCIGISRYMSDLTGFSWNGFGYPFYVNWNGHSLEIDIRELLCDISDCSYSKTRSVISSLVDDFEKTVSSVTWQQFNLEDCDENGEGEF